MLNVFPVPVAVTPASVSDIAFFIFALIFRTSGPKMAIFRGKIGEGVGRY